MLQKLRARQAVAPTLRIDHAIGRHEPALWVADIVCGAVVQQRCGRGDYLDILGAGVEIHTIGP
ncbi:Uncharacterised protein [Mycobacteroides abscessus subsp. abscessus]|nr:Uncharacterised protein [Mycobacteroides abscessus subsp. abscessus]